MPLKTVRFKSCKDSGYLSIKSVKKTLRFCNAYKVNQTKEEIYNIFVLNNALKNNARKYKV